MDGGPYFGWLNNLREMKGSSAMSIVYSYSKNSTNRYKKWIKNGHFYLTAARFGAPINITAGTMPTGVLAPLLNNILGHLTLQ